MKELHETFTFFYKGKDILSKLRSLQNEHF